MEPRTGIFDVFADGAKPRTSLLPLVFCNGANADASTLLCQSEVETQLTELSKASETILDTYADPRYYLGSRVGLREPPALDESVLNDGLERAFARKSEAEKLADETGGDSIDDDDDAPEVRPNRRCLQVLCVLGVLVLAFIVFLFTREFVGESKGDGSSASAPSEKTRAPTTAPTTAVPTASFLEITSIGTGSTCVAYVECEVLWVYRGDSAVCAEVEVTVEDMNGTLIETETTANDGQQTKTVPGAAEVNEYTMTIACSDDASFGASLEFQVSYWPQLE